MSYAAPSDASRPSRASAQPSRGPRDGDSAFAEDSRRLQDLVRSIQQHTAQIRKETSLLSTAVSCAGSQRKVDEAVCAARADLDEGRGLLGRLATGGTVSEQSKRRLTQEKLSESLMGASQAFKTAWERYNEEALAREALDRSRNAAALADPSAGGGVELGAMDAPLAAPEVDSAGPVQRQALRAQLLEEAECETHAAVVDEYVAGISNVQRDIRGLQRAMVDLAEHAQAQGDTLDNIEANLSRSSVATESANQEILQASNAHRRGTKLIYWLLLLAMLLATMVIFVVVRKGQQG